MNLSCSIIRDLMPLYAEGLASEDSRAAVEKHLCECESCRTVYEELKTAPVILPEEPGLNTVRKGIWKRRFQTALCSVLIVCMVGCWFLSWLTEPIYLDKNAITDVRNNHDGTVTICVDAAAAGRKTFQFDSDLTEAGEIFVIWTNRWLENTWTEPIARNFAITRSVMYGGIELFTGEEGAPNQRIYDNPMESTSIGTMYLPRLYLSYYFLMALGCGAFLLLLALLLRKKRAGKWMGAIGVLGLCYALCQGIVCGFTFASFFAQQELFWGIAMGICLWGALLCIWAMRRKA